MSIRYACLIDMKMFISEPLSSEKLLRHGFLKNCLLQYKMYYNNCE